MREIVMDTETTGLDPADGHRIVEIGAVELINHMPTGQTWHRYINPRRDMPKEAFDIHGLSEEFLRTHPSFEQIIDSFLEFIADARLVIHNAPFDMRFLNAELALLQRPVLPMDRALDTLAMARRRFPGSPSNLDALCRRFGIDNSAREKHGALLDSELLAEVYLELIGGRQPDLTLAPTASARARMANSAGAWRPGRRTNPLAPRLTQAERAAHAAFVAKLGTPALWAHYDTD